MSGTIGHCGGIQRVHLKWVLVLDSDLESDWVLDLEWDPVLDPEWVSSLSGVCS